MSFIKLCMIISERDTNNDNLGDVVDYLETRLGEVLINNLNDNLFPYIFTCECMIFANEYDYNNLINLVQGRTEYITLQLSDLYVGQVRRSYREVLLEKCRELDGLGTIQVISD